MDPDTRQTESVPSESLLTSAMRNARAGQPDEAFAMLTQFLSGAPDNAEALRMRAAVSLQLGDLSRSLADYDSVVALQPGCADCFFERGTVFLRSGDVQAAIDDFSRCLSIEPKHAPALASRAAMLVRANRLDEALEDITAAAALRPHNDRDIHNRAMVLAHMGRIHEAIEEYERALELNPRSGGSHNNLAWLLATSADPELRDGGRAVKHALRAVELGKNGAWMDTLAAAFAEQGNFDAAVRAEAEAYRIDGESNPSFLKRERLYRRGVSYAAWLEARRRDEDL